MHEVLAKAVALGEAGRPEFAAYARQIVANAKALAESLAERGWRVVAGGTDNHMLLIDLRSRDEELTGLDAADSLARAGLIANKNKIPFDPRPPGLASGLRFGTLAVTTRGLKEPHVRTVGQWIDQVLSSRGDERIVGRVRDEVRRMCREFPVPNQEQPGE
jgi:glycine hydroxymethyltransferase